MPFKIGEIATGLTKLFKLPLTVGKKTATVNGSPASIASEVPGEVTLVDTPVYGSDVVISVEDFNLDFTSGELDPRITFSRTSNATLIGSDGTLQYAPHNLLTYSEQFDNAYWTVTAATISANAVSAPNGTQTADQLVETVGTGTLPRLPIPITLEVGKFYSASVYAKEVSGSSKRYLQVYFNAGFASVPCGANFNLATGTVTYSSGLASTSVENVGDGWWRCTINTTVVLVAATGFRIALVDNPAQVMSLAWNPDGTGSMYLWGAQLNVDALQPYYSTTVKNLLGYSQEFDDAVWTKSRSTVTANVTAAPDGSMTADKLVEDTATGTHTAFSATAFTTTGPFTFSLYLKAAERSWVNIRHTGLSAFFNLTTGGIGTVDAGLVASIVSVGNGWYRCAVVKAAAATGAVGPRIATGDGTDNYTGDGTSGIYVWGAQFSDSASLDPYKYNPAAAPSNTAYYGPRLDYDPVTLEAKGRLIEEQRTNSIRNNTMVGAVAGTPGTLPTNWSTFTSLTGLTREVVGTGTETGINYIDIRLSGTPSAAGTYLLLDEANNVVAALTGQAWTHSLFVALAAGSTTGVSSIATVFEERTSANAFVAEQTSTAYTITATALGGARQSKTATTSGGATTAFLNAYFRVTLTGEAINITLRIGLPQLEIGAFATSVIPTTTTALTRAADVLSIIGANFSNWYNQSEGTTYVEASTLPNVTTTTISYAISDNTFNQSIYGNFSSGNAYRGANVLDGGVGQASAIASFTGLTTTNNTKDAFAYKLNDFAESCNGVATRTDNAGTVPAVNRLYIGSSWSGAGNFLNGHIRSFKYYPTRLSNAELQSLTADRPIVTYTPV